MSIDITDTGPAAPVIDDVVVALFRATDDVTGTRAVTGENVTGGRTSRSAGPGVDVVDETLTAPELLALCARQVDELAAMVEATVLDEDNEHAATQTALTQAAAAGLLTGQDLGSMKVAALRLRTRHERRRVMLTVLDDHLGQLHATLEELAVQHGHDPAPDGRGGR